MMDAGWMVIVWMGLLIGFSEYIVDIAGLSF